MCCQIAIHSPFINVSLIKKILIVYIFVYVTARNRRNASSISFIILHILALVQVITINWLCFLLLYILYYILSYSLECEMCPIMTAIIHLANLRCNKVTLIEIYISNVFVLLSIVDFSHVNYFIQSLKRKKNLLSFIGRVTMCRLKYLQKKYVTPCTRKHRFIAV